MKKKNEKRNEGEEKNKDKYSNLDKQLFLNNDGDDDINFD